MTGRRAWQPPTALSVAAQLEEPLHRRLLMVEALGERARVLGSDLEEVLRRTARGRRRADKRGVKSCCAHAIPSGGRPSASVRAPHTGVTTTCESRATSAVGSSRGAGSRTASSTE